MSLSNAKEDIKKNSCDVSTSNGSSGLPTKCLSPLLEDCVIK